MNFSLKRLTDYCIANSGMPTEILNELERETYLKTLAPQMISGPLQGQLLALISRMIRPLRILEIGTFTGYATICLAQGLQEDGQLVTVEANAELGHISQKYFVKSGLAGKIQSIHADAKEYVKTITDKYDLIFIDAGKQDYSYYYDAVLDHLNPNGVILVDNTLWSGKVTNEHKDNDTRIMDSFNKKVNADMSVDVVMLPIRDGITVIMKK